MGYETLHILNKEEASQYIALAQHASLLVYLAIERGEMTRPATCELCDATFDNPNGDREKNIRPKIEAHHWRGYEGDAIYDVLWVCQSCNRIKELKGPRAHNGSIGKDQARQIVKARKELTMTTSLSPRPQHPSGTIECCVCHIAIGFNPEINGISSGYCSACGQIALAEVEAWIAQQAAKVQAEFTHRKG